MLCGCSASSAATTAAGTRTATLPRAGSKQLAVATARARLGHLVLPAGATPLDAPPRNLRHVLSGSGPASSLAPVVDLHAYWAIQASSSSILAFLARHDGANATVASSGSGRDNTGAYYAWRELEFPARLGRITAEALRFTVAPSAGDGSVLRADVRVAWRVARPPGSLVPNTARSLSLIVARPTTVGGSVIGRELAAPTSNDTTTTVTQVVRTINSLPVAVPRAVICPAGVGDYYYWLILRNAGADRVATVRVDPYGCQDALLSTRAGHDTWLGEAGVLLKVVRQLQVKHTST